MNSTTRRHILFSLGLALCATLPISVANGQVPAVAAAVPAPADASLTAVVTGLRSDRGFLLMSVYDGPGHWPQNSGFLYHCRAPIHHGQASCTFQPVQPGHAYAIAFSHDENGNGHFDTNFIGMPQEGYGFSNDVHPGLSVPGFDRCRFVQGPGSSNVRMTAQY